MFRPEKNVCSNSFDTITKILNIKNSDELVGDIAVLTSAWNHAADRGQGTREDNLIRLLCLLSGYLIGRGRDDLLDKDIYADFCILIVDFAIHMIESKNNGTTAVDFSALEKYAELDIRQMVTILEIKICGDARWN